MGVDCRQLSKTSRKQLWMFRVDQRIESDQFETWQVLAVAGHKEGSYDMGLVSSVSQRIILPERDDLQEPLPILLLLVVAKVQQGFPAASGKRGSIPRLLRLTGFQSTGEGDGHDEAQTGTANPTFCCATTARALRAALMACFH